MPSHLAAPGLPKGGYGIMDAMTSKPVSCVEGCGILKTTLNTPSGGFYIRKIAPAR